MVRCLEIPEGMPFEDALNRLCGEIARVLRPGGQVLMLESSRDQYTHPLPSPFNRARSQRAGKMVVDMLAGHGVGYGEVTGAFGHIGSDHLFDPSRSFRGASPLAEVSIYAQK